MRKWLVGTLAALPVLYYVGTVLWYAYDFPYMDDYPTVVEFINRLPAATSLSEKVTLLMEQNNFHRLVLVKLLAWLNVGLTGSVDFRVLQYVGLGFLLLTVWLLWRTSRAEAVLLFLPALFLLFQFQGWNVAFWGIVAVSNVGAPALALLTFYLANTKREWWAITVGLVALFTNGNGILVLPLLVIGWGLQGHPRRTLAALVVTAPALWFYFQGYQNPAGPSLSTLLQPANLLHLLALDTAFLGALVYHPAVPWLPIVLGTCTVVWMGYLILTRYDKQNPTLFWLLIFLHLSGLMLAVNRIQNDTSIVFASRYRNITALHIAATYLSLFNGVILRWGKRSITPLNMAILATFALWAVSNYTYHSKIVRFRELKQTDNLLWAQFGQIRACAPQYNPAQRLGIMAERMTFRPNEADQKLAMLQSRAVTITPATTPGDSLSYGVDIREVRDGFLVVSGWAKVAGRKANFNEVYVGVKTPSGWQYYTTLFHQRLDKADSANDKDTGFTAVIPVTGKETANALPLTIFVESGQQAAAVETQPFASYLRQPSLAHKTIRQ